MIQSATTNFEKRKYLRSICPCRRNSSENDDGWQDVFNSARFGSYSERKAAAHTIGTMLQKANHVPAYRNLMKRFQCELDELMQDPRTASAVLGTMKKHGHAHKGAARQGFRKVYRASRLQSASEIATWINSRLDLGSKKALTSSTPCVQRLVKWLNHRVQFQPDRKIPEDDLLAQLRRIEPNLWSSSTH